MSTAKILAGLVPAPAAPAAQAIAEEEIAAAKRQTRSKQRTRRIHDAFKSMAPGPLIELTEDLYRHHCREIILRAANEEEMFPGTEAEVLQMLMRTSLATPLNRQGLALYERLFRSVYGALPEGMQATPEPWAGATDEMLRDARRRLRTARGSE